MNRRTWFSVLMVLMAVGQIPLRAAGTLKALDDPNLAMRIDEHHVNVVINNGFSRTEVTQTFFNPNATELECVYTFPLPISASLSEFSILLAEGEIHGEVMEREQAQSLYESEKKSGNDAGLAEKDSFLRYRFHVYPVRPQAPTTIRFVYYQPADVDTGIGRYLYPLEEGGTDEAASQFWTREERVNHAFSFQVHLKSAWPVNSVRIPGFENEILIDKVSDGEVTARLDLPSYQLSRDLVFYYRLADDLPGRVELLAHRSDVDRAGTFMMVITPGLDLKPLDQGADYVFVLDVSGSMAGKLSTLADGVTRAMGVLRPGDRFRIVSFADDVDAFNPHWLDVTPGAVDDATQWVQRLRTRGGTNLHLGISRALESLDDERATTMILVTDAVANQGKVSSKSFKKLMERYDIRVFGFLLGNSGNWPLMDVICDTSGGQWRQLSNNDDVLGALMLAKEKMTFESLHHAELEISGIKTSNLTQDFNQKIYRGQQLVIFGRYSKPGLAKVALRANMTGKDKRYTSQFEFPEIENSHPELERLWAMSFIESLQQQADLGLMDPDEVKGAVIDLGVNFQLVTDHTSMVVLTDEAFERLGIERRNLDRVTRETVAREAFKNEAPISRRVDEAKPMFDGSAPSLGGGGAINPMAALSALMLLTCLWMTRRRQS